MSKIYKTSLVRGARVFALMTLMVLGWSQVNATHIVGSDMSFRCLGNDFYEVTLIIRRDCLNGADDAPFDSPASVGIFDQHGNPLSFLGQLGQVLMPFEGMTEIHPGRPDCGYFGGGLCVEEATYKANVYLPFRAGGYILAYQRCCRNVTLNNIVSPLETGTSKFVCLTEETLNSCNSSPEFQDWPELIICANEPLSFGHAAVDRDGDSLVYKLFTPHSGATIDFPKPQPPPGPPYDSVTWAQGFSLENVLGGGEPLTINPETGRIRAVPGVVGQFLVGVLVEEWRDGKILSKVRRDFEYNVRVCNDIAVIDFEVDDLVCDGLTVDVTNTSADNFGYTWNFNHPSEDPAFISTETTPSFTYAEPGTYQISLSSTHPDNDCENIVIKEISVFDADISLDFDAKAAPCNNGLANLRLTAQATDGDTTNSIAQVAWLVTANGLNYEATGDDVVIPVQCVDDIEVTAVALSSSGCDAVLVKSFNLDDITEETKLIDLAGDTLYICEGESVALFNSAQSGVTYTWTPIDGLIFADTERFSDPMASPADDTKYTVTATDGVESDTAMVLVIVDAKPVYEITPSRVELCEGAVASAAITSEMDLTYVWSPTDGIDVTDAANPIFSNRSSQYYYVDITNGGCTVRDSVFIDVTPTEVSGVEEDIVFDIQFDSTSNVLTSNINADELIEKYDITSIRWEVIVGDETYSGEGTDIDITVGATDLDAKVIYFFSDSQGCEYMVMTVVTREKGDESDVKLIDLVGDTLYICEGESVALFNSAQSGVTYTWTPIDGLTFTDTERFSDPVASPADDTKYTVTATDGEETATAMVLVIVDAVPVYEITPSTVELCEGAVASAEITSEMDLTYVWSPTDGIDVTDAASPIFSNRSSQYYYVDITNGGCTVRDSVFIDVTPTEVSGVEEDIVFDIQFDSTSNVLTSSINAEELIEKYDITSIRWEVIVGEETYSGDGTDIDITVGATDLEAKVIYFFSDSQGCEYMVMTVVTREKGDESEMKLIDLVGDTLYICEGESVALFNSAHPGVTYTWTPIDGLTFTDTERFSDPVASPADDTKYTVTATDGEETATAMVLVIVDAVPVYEITPSTVELCEGAVASAAITSEMDLTYVWSPTEGIDVTDPTNPTFSNRSSQYYYVDITNGGCTVRDSVFIDVTPTEVSGVESDIVFDVNVDTTTNGLTVSINEEELLAKYDITGIRWEVTAGGESFSGDGSDIDITYPEGATEAKITYFFSDSQGCEYMIMQIIRLNTDDPFNLIDIAGDTLYICEGESVALLNSAIPNLVYNWEPTEGLTFTDLVFFSDPVASPADDTKYTVSVQAGPVSDTAMIVVIVDEYPVYEISQDTVQYCEGSTGSVDITSEQPLTYSWRPVDGVDQTNGAHPIFSARASGYYYVTISNGGCDVLDSVYLDVLPTEVSAIEKDVMYDIVFDEPSRQLTIDINADGFLDQFDVTGVRWELTAGDAQFGGDGTAIDMIIPAGIDMVKVVYFITDSQGCEYMIMRLIDLNNLEMPMIEFVMDDTIRVCLGDTAQIIANPNSEWTYTWIPETDLIFESDDDKSNPSFVGDTSRLYIVSVSDGVNTVTDSVFVNVVNDMMMLSFAYETGTHCEGKSHQMVINPDHGPNTTYEWSLTPDFAVIYATAQSTIIPIDGDSAIIYVRAEDPRFCGSNVASLPVYLDSLDLSVAFDTIDFCKDTQLSNVIVTNNQEGKEVTYQWDASDNIVSMRRDTNAIVVTASDRDTAVTFAYSADDGRGCRVMREVVVPVVGNLIPTIDSDTDADCSGTVELTVSSQELDATYEWSLDNQFAEIAGTGSMFTLTDMTRPVMVYVRGAHPDYCVSAVDSLMVNMGMLDISIDYDPINTCVDNTTEVNVTASDSVTVTWTPSDNITSDINALPLTVTFADGQEQVVLYYSATNGSCIEGDSIVIDVTMELTASIMVDTASCDGTFGSFAAIVNATPATYEWSFDPEFGSVISTDSIVTLNLPEGQKLYMRATSGSCVSDVAEISPEEAGFNIMLDSPEKICVGDTIDVTATAGNKEFDINWVPSQNLIATNGKTITVVGLEGQDSIVLIYVAESADGCRTDGRMSIVYGSDVAPDPQVSVQCGSYSLSFDTEGFTDGEIMWDFGTADDDSDQSTAASPSFDFMAPGTYTVNVSSLQTTCIFDAFSFDVVVPDTLDLTTMSDRSVSMCAGGDTTMTIGAATTSGLPIVWTSAAGDTLMIGDSLTFASADHEMVIATVADTFGCSKSLTFTVANDALDPMVIFPDGVGNACPGVAFPIHVIDSTRTGLTFDWMPASAIVSGQGTGQVMVQLDGPTMLTVVVTDPADGCTQEITIDPMISSISVDIMPADPDEDTEVCRGESLTLVADSPDEIVSYLWSDGSTTETIEVSPEENTTYTVTVTDANGCTATDEINITVVQPQCNETDIFIPNAFSPNGDSQNDVLFVRSKFVESLDFHVVNRWGQEVFRTTDINTGWNGRFSNDGKELAPDVYAYCAKVTCVGGQTYMITGNVSLIR